MARARRGLSRVATVCGAQVGTVARSRRHGFPLVVVLSLVTGVLGPVAPVWAAPVSVVPGDLPGLVADPASRVASGAQGRGPLPAAPSPLSFTSSAPPSASAALNATPTGFVPGASVVSSRSAMSTDYVNPDGTHTAVLATEPVNYQTPDSVWHPVDNSVQADPALPGGFRNTANSWRVHFGSSTDGVTMDTSAGSVGLSLVGAARAAPSASPDGHGVVYPGVLPGASLKYSVTGSSVKESVLITSRTAPTSYTFAVRSGAPATVLADGGDATPSFDRRSDGSVAPAGAIGSQLAFEPPVVTRPDGSTVPEANATMVSSPGRLVLSIDPTWLAAQPDSAFPIDLDPSAQIGVNTTYSYKSDGYTCSNCNIQVGNSVSAGDTYWRSMAYFPLAPYFGTQILNASLAATYVTGTTSAYTMNEVPREKWTSMDRGRVVRPLEGCRLCRTAGSSRRSSGFRPRIG
jgi:hypothetical protein